MIDSDGFGLFLWFLVSKNQVIFGYRTATFATGSSSQLLVFACFQVNVSEVETAISSQSEFKCEIQGA